MTLNNQTLLYYHRPMSHQKPSGDGTQNNGGAVFYSSSVANSTATVNSIFGAVDEKAEIRENTLAALNNTLALLKVWILCIIKA